MNYFKDKNTNEVYAYDQEQIDGGWVKEGLVAMTDAEFHEFCNPTPTPEQLAKQAKAEALRYLADTDWYVVRLTETGVAIPEEVSIKRAEARAIL